MDLGCQGLGVPLEIILSAITGLALKITIGNIIRFTGRLGEIE
jgi:hypothetical protein